MDMNVSCLSRGHELSPMFQSQATHNICNSSSRESNTFFSIPMKYTQAYTHINENRSHGTHWSTASLCSREVSTKYCLEALLTTGTAF